jgi:hypothetical protein
MFENHVILIILKDCYKVLIGYNPDVFKWDWSSFLYLSNVCPTRVFQYANSAYTFYDFAQAKKYSVSCSESMGYELNSFVLDIEWKEVIDYAVENIPNEIERIVEGGAKRYMDEISVLGNTYTFALNQLAFYQELPDNMKAEL